MKKIIKIGSRESKLAIIQTEKVINEIKKISPEIKCEIITMKTTGDKILDKTLDKIGGKGLFMKELDAALLDGRVDICVHSLKDVPSAKIPELPLTCFLKRESPFDVLVLPKNIKEQDFSLPVGCSSQRRIEQYKKIYPQAKFKPIRGNVLTRLKKLDENKEYGALILAEAGLKRLGLESRINHIFTADEIVPAAGQGIIAVRQRAGEYFEFLDKINNINSQKCGLKEREMARNAKADCGMPYGAYAEIINGKMITREFKI